jgi:prepilin-type N-terminal cleavage/methylation domain-containing protein
MAECQGLHGTRRAAAGRHGGDAGFTLAEMLAALAILLIGVTTLLASLGGSIALRRSTDARTVAAEAVEGVFVTVQQAGVKLRPDAATDLDLELDLPASFEVSGFPGLRCSVTAATDAARPEVWLVRARMQWLEAGEAVIEDFVRVLPRQLPLAARVQRFRADRQPNQR